MRFLNHLYFGPSFVFQGTILGGFSQCFFQFFVMGQPWWSTFLSPHLPRHHKKASYGPVLVMFLHFLICMSDA